MGHSVSYEVSYGTDKLEVPVLYEEPNYGTTLIGGKDSEQFYIDGIRDSVSVALTDYLKANLD